VKARRSGDNCDVRAPRQSRLEIEINPLEEHAVIAEIIRRSGPNSATAQANAWVELSKRVRVSAANAAQTDDECLPDRLT
jgi:hypothetical protein